MTEKSSRVRGKRIARFDARSRIACVPHHFSNVFFLHLRISQLLLYSETRIYGSLVLSTARDERWICVLGQWPLATRAHQRNSARRASNICERTRSEFAVFISLFTFIKKKCIIIDEFNTFFQDSYKQNQKTWMRIERESSANWFIVYTRTRWSLLFSL